MDTKKVCLTGSKSATLTDMTDTHDEILRVVGVETPEWILGGYSHRFFYGSWGANTKRELKRRVEQDGYRYYGSLTRDNLQIIRERQKKERQNARTQSRLRRDV